MITFNKNRGELNKLCQFIEQRNLIVEIGSLAGVSTEIFAKYFNRVVSVDPYISGYDDSDINSQKHRLDEAKEIFQSKFNSNPSVNQLNITSEQASGLYDDDSSIDLVYIDASHTYQSVLHDIELWNRAVLDCFDEKHIKIFKPNHWIVKL